MQKGKERMTDRENRRKRKQKNAKRNRRRREYAAEVRAGVGTKRTKPGRPPKEHTSSQSKRQSELDVARYRTAKEIVKTKNMLKDGNLENGLTAMVTMLKPAPGVKTQKAVVKAFEPVYKYLQRHETLAEVGEGACEFIQAHAKSANAKSLIKCMGVRVTDRRMYADLIDRPLHYVRNALIPTFQPKQFDDARSLPKTATTRRKAVDMLGDIVEVFFKSKTSVASGAKRETRNLAMGFEKLRTEFYSVYPKLLRDYAQQHPLLCDKIRAKGKKRKSFEAQLLLAVTQAQESDFCQEQEILIRKKYTEDKYNDALLKKRLISKGYSLEDIQKYMNSRITAKDMDDLDKLTSEELVQIIVPQPRLFWGIIKDRNIRWTVNTNPTECIIHDKGPLWKLELARLEAELLNLKAKLTSHEKRGNDLKKEGKQADCQEHVTETYTLLEKYLVTEGNMREARHEVARYDRHLEQYATCRAIVKTLEQGLTVGEAVVYRDFVAQYMYEGSKVNNLLLVVLWRKTPGGILNVFKLNHFCSDKEERAHDSYYVADVFDWYFRCAGVTSDFFRSRGITRIFLSGDHGSHFSSRATVFNESCMFQKYGVQIHCFFLCSYHCYNRCDPAGVESKRLSEQATKQRRGFKNAGQFAAALNNSAYHNSYGYEFKCINRDVSTFADAHRGDKDEFKEVIREKCEIKYEYIDQNGCVVRTPGIALCRAIPSLPTDKGGGPGKPFEVLDLRKDPAEGKLCTPCSNSKQRPVWHGKKLCPTIRENTEETILAKQKLRNAKLHGPSDDRIVSTLQDCSKKQLKAHLDAVKKTLQEGVGQYPCKVVNCPFGFYTKAHGANQHMKGKHNFAEDDARLYETAKARKEKEKRQKEAAKLLVKPSQRQITQKKSKKSRQRYHGEH